MKLLTQDFLANRYKFRRYKKFIAPIGGSVALVALLVGAVYLSKNAPDSEGEQKVASSRLPKAWLLKYFGTKDVNHESVGGEMGDPDNDILTNLQEFRFGTDPTNEDTDGDGDIDSYEVAFGQNPRGEGKLEMTSSASDYIDDVIESDKELAEFSRENVLKRTNELFQPDRTVVFDFPDDSELVLSKQNDVPGFEKYFEDVKGLTTGEESDTNIASRLFGDLSREEIDNLVNKLQTTISLLKETPVPSEIANIHKIKIAGLRAGIRMLELVRDNYNPDLDSDQFWRDVFYQITILETADAMEIAAWRELGLKLKDAGGI